MESVHIPVDRMTMRQKSFAFVRFHHEESVPYAVDLMGDVKLYGRSLKLQNKATGVGITPPQHHLPTEFRHRLDQRQSHQQPLSPEQFQSQQVGSMSIPTPVPVEMMMPGPMPLMMPGHMPRMMTAGMMMFGQQQMMNQQMASPEFIQQQMAMIGSSRQQGPNGPSYDRRNSSGSEVLLEHSSNISGLPPLRSSCICSSGMAGGTGNVTIAIVIAGTVGVRPFMIGTVEAESTNTTIGIAISQIGESTTEDKELWAL